MELGIRNTAGSWQLQDIQACGLRTLYFWDFPSTFAKENIREWSLGINPSASLPTASAWAKLPERRNENHTDIISVSSSLTCIILDHEKHYLKRSKQSVWRHTTTHWVEEPWQLSTIMTKEQTPFWDSPESHIYISPPDIGYTVVFITSC